MFGRWGDDARCEDIDGPPFEIEAQGLGLFSCWKYALPPFNPEFRGFGGEEFYLHDKFRQYGGKVLCHPSLRWIHRFGRPNGVPFLVDRKDMFRNYMIGWRETGRDANSIVDHYVSEYGLDVVRAWMLDLTTEVKSG